ncbi:MAG: RNHCP domain-containing protein [Candidatus Kerfeldbacteria bacterium]
MQVFQPKTKQFQRNKEDFVCEKCGAAVYGDGYRNHCPVCLTSKHVDINPGDREATCGGLMSVDDIELSHGKLVFTHKCDVCGYTKKNKAHPEDDQKAIEALMKEFERSGKK